MEYLDAIRTVENTEAAGEETDGFAKAIIIVIATVALTGVTVVP